MPFLRKARCPVLVNIFGSTEEEYAEMARRLSEAEGIAGLEVNISCPNMKAGGAIFAAEAKSVHQVVSKLRQATSSFLMVKLSPNVADIVKIAGPQRRPGRTPSPINTSDRAGHRRPDADACPGEYHRRAFRPGHQAHRPADGLASGPGLRIPVVGIGGIVSAEDALEYLIAGATAVQVGSAHFIDPRAGLKIIDGIQNYLTAARVLQRFFRHRESEDRPGFGRMPVNSLLVAGFWFLVRENTVNQ